MKITVERFQELLALGYAPSIFDSPLRLFLKPKVRRGSKTDPHEKHFAVLNLIKLHDRDKLLWIPDPHKRQVSSESQNTSSTRAGSLETASSSGCTNESNDSAWSSTFAGWSASAPPGLSLESVEQDSELPNCWANATTDAEPLVTSDELRFPLWNGTLHKNQSETHAWAGGAVNAQSQAPQCAEGASLFREPLMQNNRGYSNQDFYGTAQQNMMQWQCQYWYPPIPPQSAVPMDFSFGETVPIKRPGRNDSWPPTTLMLRNIPNRFHRSQLMKVLDDVGFASQYDFLYLVFDWNSGFNKGYAFINFISPQQAQKFSLRLDQGGFQGRKLDTNSTDKKTCDVKVALTQTFEENVKRFRDLHPVNLNVHHQKRPIMWARGPSDSSWAGEPVCWRLLNGDPDIEEDGFVSQGQHDQPHVVGGAHLQEPQCSSESPKATKPSRNSAQGKSRIEGGGGGGSGGGGGGGGGAAKKGKGKSKKSKEK